MTRESRQPWLIVAAIVAGCLLIALYLGRPAVAVPRGKAPAAEPGRYQSACGPTNLYLVDTATGRTWYAKQEPDAKGKLTWRWADMISPVPPKRR
jgi:hypothetical protein